MDILRGVEFRVGTMMFGTDSPCCMERRCEKVWEEGRLDDIGGEVCGQGSDRAKYQCSHRTGQMAYSEKDTKFWVLTVLKYPFWNKSHTGR